MSIADLKHQELPLARIKKIMKLDEDVKVSSSFSAEVAGSLFSSKPPQMISAEAPVLFAKAAEMFIHELTMRAWIHTEVRYLLTTSEIAKPGWNNVFELKCQDNKRRTLQRNDIAMAITKYDQFDFLIDIVPRCCCIN